MQMNSGLILAGDKPDIAGGVFRANEQAFAQGQRNRENALQTFMRDQGGALYNGDGNAMQQYAQFDPQAAVGMRNAEEARQRARQAAARAAAAASRRNAAAASAQENEALQTAFRVMGEARAQGPEVFAATAQQFGYSDEMARYNITFDNFDQASRIVNAEMGWEQPQPAALPEVNFDIPDGYMLSDPQNPRAGVMPIQGIQPAAPEVSIREDVNGISRYVGGPQHGQQVFESVSATPEGFRPATPEEAARYGAAAGQINISTNEFKAINPPSSMAMTMGPDGTMTYSQGAGVTGGMPDMTGAEANNAGFLLRTRESNEVINELENEGTSFWDNTAKEIPIVGNYLIDEAYQRYSQAQQDFINAQLRRESGAAISDPEYTRANNQYFPQPGDTPATIAQKRRNREAAIRGMEVGSGDAMNHPLMAGGQTPVAQPPNPQDAAINSALGVTSQSVSPISNMDPRLIEQMTRTDLQQLDIGSLAGAGLSDAQWDALEALAERYQ